MPQGKDAKARGSAAQMAMVRPRRATASSDQALMGATKAMNRALVALMAKVTGTWRALTAIAARQCQEEG